jgi:predicted MPP superfamily phosphohydrolase
MFILVAFTIWGSILAHFHLRSCSLLGIRGKAALWSGIGVYLLGFAYIPARILLAKEIAEGFAAGLEYAASWFIGIVCLVWTFLVPIELGALVVFLVSRRRLRDASPKTRFKLGAAIWIHALCLAVFGFYTARSTPSTTTVQVTVPGGAPARYVMLADSHLGANSSESQWRRTLEAVRDLNPDALLIPGDLIDDHSSYTAPQVDMLRQLLTDSPIYVTTGNHEYYAGTERFINLCRRLDLRLLQQETVDLPSGLTLAGIDDLHYGAAGESVREVLPHLQGPVLFLTHRPAAAEHLRDRPMTLALSGHTHGGQTLPMVFLVALGNGGFRSGHYPVGDAHLYVTRGSGVWGPPLRILSPPEIVLIETVPGRDFEVRVR